MRWLLFLLFTFSTFGAWAGNCDLNTSHIQKGIEGYGTYISNPSPSPVLWRYAKAPLPMMTGCLFVSHYRRRDYPDRRSAAQHRV